MYFIICFRISLNQSQSAVHYQTFPFLEIPSMLYKNLQYGISYIFMGVIIMNHELTFDRKI